MNKICKYCQNDYPEEYFEIANIIDGKKYRRRKCKFCYCVTKRKRRHTVKALIDEYKKGLKCLRCGIDDFRVIDFHHPNKNKEFNIADMINGFGPKRILSEIKKCEPICSNCHRILHHEEKSQISSVG